MATSSCRVQVRDNIAILAPVGEFDFGNADVLRNAALEVARAEVPLALVDMAETTFLDSTAIGVLVGLHRRLKTEYGGRVVIANPGRLPGKALQLLGINRIMEFVDGVNVDTWAPLSV